MAASKRVGAIDVGTNTVLLLIAEGDADAPRAIVERATITRLGQGVDGARRLLPDALDRTVACLEGYAAVLRDHGVGRVDAVCTSATRDAENGEEFLDAATRVLGVRPRVIDGNEEARLTFSGALTGMSREGDVTVFDVGGGSTEIIYGTVDRFERTVRTAFSIDIGSVRLTERHVRSDPPSLAELAAVRADIARALAAVPQNPTTELVGVAGTVTTLSAIDQGLLSYDPARVHGAALSRSSVERIAAHLAALSLSERKRVPGLDPARADVIVTGALLVLALLDWAGVDRLRVSDRGVRWGVACAALGAPAAA